jgi:hypothetical protein
MSVCVCIYIYILPQMTGAGNAIVTVNMVMLEIFRITGVSFYRQPEGLNEERLILSTHKY